MVSRVAKGFSPNRLHHGVVGRKRLSGTYRPRLSTTRDSATTSKMKVVIRVRPQSGKELEGNQRSVVETMSSEMLMFDPAEDREAFFFRGMKQGQRDINRKQNKEMKFNFDRVFDSESTNEQVFEGTMRSILNSLIDGYNCSVFAYGATGAGKTFTMLGNPPASYGITYLTMIELYRLMESFEHERAFEVRVSYLEVYNETVKDLLVPSDKQLNLRDNGGLGVHISGLQIQVIKSAEELLNLLKSGNMNRTQHPTDANAESSRSHAVFQVHIRMVDKVTRCAKLVKLSMIDLAGSERAAATGCRGVRFNEGANINKSLLSLGNCINALADGLKHVPYRDSKLTRLLKDSLGGNCNTVMIANVSPSVQSYEDTYNTLKYASRAKKIKTKLSRNIVNMDPVVAQYAPVIEALQLEVAQLKAELKEAKEAKTAAADQSGGVQAAQQQQRLQLCLQELRNCYDEKTGLHMEVMKFDGLVKCVKYRKTVKLDSAFRLRELCFHDNAALEKALARVYKKLVALDNQIVKYNAELQRRLDLLADNDKRMDILQKQIVGWELEDLVKPDNDAHVHKLRELENNKVVLHLLRMAVTQHSQLEAQDKVVVEMAKTLASYHAILQGHDMMTTPMDANFKKIERILEGVKVVTWGQTHETTLNLDEPVVEEATSLEIPPKITDFMALKFSQYKPQPAGSASNISQLNYSREDMLSNSPRYSVDLKSREKFIKDVIGNIVQSGVEGNLGQAGNFDSADHSTAYFNRDTDSSSKLAPVVPSETIQRDTKYAQECHPKKYANLERISDILRDDIDLNATFSPAKPADFRTALNETYVSEAQMAMAAASSNLEELDKVGKVQSIPKRDETYASEAQMAKAATSSNLEILDKVGNASDQGTVASVGMCNETYVSEAQMAAAMAASTNLKLDKAGKKTIPSTVPSSPNFNETFVSDTPTTSNDLGNCSVDLNVTFVSNTRLPAASAENGVGNQGLKISGADLNSTIVLKKRVETQTALDAKKSLKGNGDLKRSSPVDGVAMKTALDAKKSSKGNGDLKRSSPVDRVDMKKLCNKENIVGSVPSATAPLVFLKPTLCVPKAPKLKTGKQEPRTPGPANRIPLKTNNQSRVAPGSARKIQPTNGKTASTSTIQRPHGQHPYSRQLGLPTPQRPKKI